MFRATTNAMGPNVSRNFKAGDILRDLATKDKEMYFDAGAIQPVKKQSVPVLDGDGNPRVIDGNPVHKEVYVIDDRENDKLKRASEKRPGSVYAPKEEETATA